MRLINNFSEYKSSPAFINSVVVNPVAVEIGNAKSSLASADANLNTVKRNLVDYENNITELKRKHILYATEIDRIKKKISILEKIGSKISGDGALEKFNAKQFDAFLRPLGLRFFSCHMVSEYVYFTFVREAKKISYMVTPPLLIRLTYRFNRDHSNYYVNSASAMPLVHFNSHTDYVHPHINSSSDSFKPICMGNYFDVMKSSSVPATLSNWQDHCMLLDQMLSTYNPDSPYIRMDILASNFKSRGYAVNDYDKTGNYVSIDSISNFVLLAEGLTQATRYNPENILTKGMFDRFESLVKDMDVKGIAEDMLAKLTMIYFKDSYESCQELSDFEDNISLDIGDEMLSLDDYKEYDEDSDSDIITEESFDEVKAQWIEVITKAMTSKKSIKVPEFPKEQYTLYFGDEVVADAKDSEEVAKEAESTIAVEGE